MSRSLDNELLKLRHLMAINEDGSWRWESGVSRGKANPLISAGDKSYGWESGVSRGNANPLYEDDDNGDGILLYHGSNSSFSTFLTDFIGGEQAADREGPGIYFTTNKEDAAQYGTNIYTVRIRPNRILSDNSGDTVSRSDMQKLITMAPDWEMNAYDWNEDLNKGLKLSLDSVMSNPTPKDIITQVWYYYYRYESIKYAKNAVSLGYDGISVKKEWDATHYIIYNPQIIEVVDKNSELDLNEVTVYHGTDAKYDKFDLNYIGTSDGRDLGGWGVYFTTDPEVAAHYITNGEVKTYEINRGNFFDFADTLASGTGHQILRALHKRGVEESEIEEFESDYVGYEYDVTNQQAYDWLKYVLGSAKEASLFLKDLGYDGNILPDRINPDAMDYVIYNINVIRESFNEGFEYHDDDNIKGKDIYDYDPTQAEIKKFLADKYQWNDWVELSKEADRVAKIEKAQEKKQKTKKPQPNAYLRRLSAQIDYGPVALMNYKLRKLQDANPAHANIYSVQIDPKTLQECTITKRGLLESIKNETSIPGGMETGLYNKTIMEDPLEEKVDSDFFDKNPNFYVTKNKDSLKWQKAENDDINKRINSERKAFESIDIDDVHIVPNKDNQFTTVFYFGDLLHVSMRQYDARNQPIWFGANNFGSALYKILIKIIESGQLEKYYFVGVEVDVINKLIKHLPNIFVVYYTSKREPATLMVTKDKGLFISAVKEIKSDKLNHIAYFNAKVEGKDATDYGTIGANRVKLKLKNISPDDIVFTTSTNMGYGQSGTYNVEFKDKELNAEVQKYHLINKPFFEYSSKDHRVHNNGINEIVRSIGLGYKIYKAFIKKVGYITSDQQTTVLGTNLYYSLLRDQDFYHIVNKKPNSLDQKIYIIWKGYKGIGQLIDSIPDLQSHRNDYDIDPRIENLLKI